MDDKLKRLKEAAAQRLRLDDEIKTLKLELAAEVIAASGRKARAPRKPKQKQLPLNGGQ